MFRKQRLPRRRLVLLLQVCQRVTPGSLRNMPNAGDNTAHGGNAGDSEDKDKDANRWKGIIYAARASASGMASRRHSLQLPAPAQ